MGIKIKDPEGGRQLAEFKCLVVDDDIDIAKTTAEYFNIFDITTAYVTSAQDAITFVKTNEVSLLLLDINLGDGSGFEVCKQIRNKFDMPILFISARTSDDDILTALNIGGDDYIKKPYTLNILLAKVKAILKRYEKQKEIEKNKAVSEKDQATALLSCQEKTDGLAKQTTLQITPELSLDYNYHQLFKKGESVKLKEMEFRLLTYLVENKNRVISKDELFSKVWIDNFVGDGTLTVHIRHLREKIEDQPNQPKYIKTIWGVGYVFETLE